MGMVADLAVSMASLGFPERAGSRCLQREPETLPGCFAQRDRAVRSHRTGVRPAGHCMGPLPLFLSTLAGITWETRDCWQNHDHHPKS